MKEEQNRTASGAEINDGWEKRFEKATEMTYPMSDAFYVSVTPRMGVLVTITQDEERRLRSKLAMIERFMQRMAMGMLKGTLKYDTDNRTYDEWRAEFDDEFIDMVNYRVFMEETR